MSHLRRQRFAIPSTYSSLLQALNESGIDPETQCVVYSNDTPTVRCCGQPFDYDRNM